MKPDCTAEGFAADGRAADRSAAALPYPVIQAHQTHGDRVEVITRPGVTREELEGVDALVTNLRGVAIGVRTADCVPVLLYDPVHRAVAAIHAGWKGTVQFISAKAIRVMWVEYGTDPSDLIAVIGPSIGPDSFQVGEEVAEVFLDAGFPASIISDCGERVPGTMQGGLHIDLWQANRWILESSGIPTSNISISGIDTFTDTRFFSARREGPACGRIINSIVLL